MDCVFSKNLLILMCVNVKMNTKGSFVIPVMILTDLLLITLVTVFQNHV